MSSWTRIVIWSSLISLIGVSSGGCSALWVNGPPGDYQARDYFHCTEDKHAVVLDGIAAAINGLAVTLSVMAAASDSVTITDGQGLPVEDEGSAAIATAVINGAIGAFYLGSAISGNAKVDQCRAAKAYSARQRRRPGTLR